MHFLQQAAIAAIPHAESAMLAGAGAILLAFNAWMGGLAWRMSNKLNRVYLAVCGNPDIDGDKGLAGRVHCHDTQIENHEHRLHELERDR